MSQEQREQIFRDLARYDKAGWWEKLQIWWNAVQRHPALESSLSDKAKEALAALQRQRDNLPEGDERKAKEKEIADVKERLCQYGITVT